MTTAVTAVEAALENLRQLRLCQALLRPLFLTSLQPQPLIPTARILLAGSIATEMAVGGTRPMINQDVPTMVTSMEQN